MVLVRQMVGIAGAHQRGSVALEFLMLFPLVVAMLYAAAIYSVLFYSKYQLQDAVDKAVASAMRVDRSRAVDSDSLQSAVTTLSTSTLAAVVSGLPGAVANAVDDGASSCAMVSSGGVDLLQCSIQARVNGEESPLVKQLSFGFLGAFPPLPETITVQSVIAI
ncbi:TadE/TadG family type IV pilus assembly protein [Marinobacter sp. SS21]|uniref:TadE/TadG family type IV pilus assembly protein n=1 Tax=Marinobacter sp. SS21 TaxID=2979460 RepID=UPI00232A873B|nr:TadE/TadG family type IV pilus assembly protein [Marinobacter sp. SS21]MDC0661250.1 TadE/TadG family type IV pilus assembly protein [Marinobacter sp. SS21]